MNEEEREPLLSDGDESQLDPDGEWSDFYFDWRPDHGHIIAKRRLMRNGGHESRFMPRTPFNLHRVKRRKQWLTTY